MKVKGLEFDKAKSYAFLLLKFRLRSQQELYGRLKRKNFSEEVILGVIDFLKEKRFIDDELFTVEWIESRLKKKIGLRRIKQELRLKGLENRLIEDHLNNLKGYSEIDTVAELAKKRMSKLKSIDKISAKRRIYAYLLRRGFSAQTAGDCLAQL